VPRPEVLPSWSDYAPAGVYIERGKFRWVKAPTTQELTQLAHTIASRTGHFLERQGLLERDIENSYLAADAVEVIVCIKDPVVIKKILTHLKEKSVSELAAMLPESWAPPQSDLFG